jgi:hypothetical protein
MKTENKELKQVKRIIQAVEQADTLWQEKILEEFGVKVLWIDEHPQIRGIAEAIARR